MALKRLPVLFFVAESTAEGRLRLRKGLREGSETAISAHKSLLHFKICIQTNKHSKIYIKTVTENVLQSKMQHVKCDEMPLKTA